MISGCDCLVALEAAHIIPVSNGGGDKDWNGIPLRADLHRLFDDGLIELKPHTFRLTVHRDAQKDYGQYNDVDITSLIPDEIQSKISVGLLERYEEEK